MKLLSKPQVREKVLYGVAFIPFGREFNEPRSVGRGIGLVDQTATVQIRLDLYGYEAAPAGSIILDRTSPVPAAGIMRRLIEKSCVDIALFKPRWVAGYLERLEWEGGPLQDRPPQAMA